MIALIVYDISDDDNRNKLADYLKSRGFTRIQRSVFVGRPLSNVMADVERSLNRFIKDSTDVIHVFSIPEIYLRNVRVYGRPWSSMPSLGREILVIR
ncbi:MAG: CRISPR-associated endonuclease Cas2 [Sulfolobales archaeon]